MNMTFFDYEHLPEHLQAVSKPFHDLAQQVQRDLGTALTEDGTHFKLHNPEAEMCLRKLLEAKDCAVRARLEMK